MRGIASTVSSVDAFLNRLRAYRPALSIEVVTLLVTAFFMIFCNGRLFQALMEGRDWGQPQTWMLAAAVLLAVTGLQFAGFSLLVTRWTVKPVLSLLIVATAFATFFAQRYGVIYDPNMMRNFLHTEVKEARELLTPSLIPHLLLYAGIPLVALWSVRIKRRAFVRAILVRAGAVVGALIIAGASILWVFQDLSALVRNNRQFTHFITPSAPLVTLIQVVSRDATERNAPRLPVGLDARVTGARKKPTLLLLVVGETARAANWGMNGYARQTTPELAKLRVINFTNVSSCGTDTEVSVPCMFSPFGRRRYDERKIRQHESLLHVLDHAGIKTLWRDNQTGCKRVCSDLPTERISGDADPMLCDGELCLDEILLKGLDTEVKNSPGDLAVVLHPLGSHGPAYFRRYPAEFRRFVPTCDTEDLGRCTKEEVVNAYDNSLLYTDRFLARAIGFLSQQTTHRTVLLYVSDHGESLGEHGLFLHGMPYYLAPKEQTQVPMVLWTSADYASDSALDTECLNRLSTRPTSHDALFHTVLGLMSVETEVYDPSLDLTSECRTSGRGSLASGG